MSVCCPAVLSSLSAAVRSEPCGGSHALTVSAAREHGMQVAEIETAIVPAVHLSPAVAIDEGAIDRPRLLVVGGVMLMRMPGPMFCFGGCSKERHRKQCHTGRQKS
jgi:hypothetical protein